MDKNQGMNIDMFSTFDAEEMVDTMFKGAITDQMVFDVYERQQAQTKRMFEELIGE